MRQVISELESFVGEHLAEKTFNLDKDVDYLYKKLGFDDVAKAVKKRDREALRRAIQIMDRYLARSSSDELKSKDAKRAHRLNPIKIVGGVFGDGSAYIPKDSKIILSLNKQQVSFLNGVDYSFERIEDLITHQADRFWNELSGPSIKGTIYHELAHWVDDTLHDRHISKELEMSVRKRAAEPTTKGAFLKGGKYQHVNHTPIELNAQVHAVKILRQQLGGREFNNLTWKKLFLMKPSLIQNLTRFASEEAYMDTLKRFVKRLHREKLLPKNMRNIPSWIEMQAIAKSI